VRDGVIVLRDEKHRHGKAGEQIAIPILAPLAASIAATRTGDLTIDGLKAGYKTVAPYPSGLPRAWSSRKLP
jgi:hypothetical protein